MRKERSNQNTKKSYGIRRSFVPYKKSFSLVKEIGFVRPAKKIDPRLKLKADYSQVFQKGPANSNTLSWRRGDEDNVPTTPSKLLKRSTSYR